MTIGPSRDLSDREQALLRHLLSADFAGVDKLRAQVAGARVGGRWADGSPSFDIIASVDAPRAGIPDGPAPITASIVEKGAYIGELILWISNGVVSSLEYAWVTDDPPQELPEPDQVNVSTQ